MYLYTINMKKSKSFVRWPKWSLVSLNPQLPHLIVDIQRNFLLDPGCRTCGLPVESIGFRVCHSRMCIMQWGHQSLDSNCAMYGSVVRPPSTCTRWGQVVGGMEDGMERMGKFLDGKGEEQGAGKKWEGWISLQYYMPDHSLFKLPCPFLSLDIQ